MSEGLGTRFLNAIEAERRQVDYQRPQWRVSALQAGLLGDSRTDLDLYLDVLDRLDGALRLGFDLPKATA